MFKIFLLLTVNCLLLTSFVFAQENNSDHILNLREQIRELERQSAEYKKLISRKHQESETLKRETAILENQIAKLRINILATSRRIDLAGLEINNLNEEIFETEEKVNKNKNAVSSILRELYGLEKQDLGAMILAKSKLSDFFGQLERLNSLRDQLTANLKIFKELKQELEIRQASTKEKKTEFETLNRRRQNQKASFEGTKTAKKDLLAKTKGLEKKFQELLDEVETKKAEFYRELQSLEEEARKEGIYIVRVKADSIPPKRTKLFQLPIDDAVITQGYGMTLFARRGAYGGAPHNGIDMTAGLGAEIKSIGEGTVLAKGFNNAAGNWVAIKHNNDLVSIYGHMRDPALVLAEEKVAKDTVIGYEGATGFVTGAHLHLSLYHEFFTFIGPKTGQVYFNYFDGSLNPLDYI